MCLNCITCTNLIIQRVIQLCMEHETCRNWELYMSTAVRSTHNNIMYIPITRVADGGFVCTSMSRPKLFKNYLIGGH